MRGSKPSKTMLWAAFTLALIWVFAWLLYVAVVYMAD